MSSMDEDEYGGIPDEDLIDALSQPSQDLPCHPVRQTRRSERETTEDSSDEGLQKTKSKYRIHETTREAPPPQIIGATQAEAYETDSSPERIRGAIYRRPRPEPTHPPKPPAFINQVDGPRYKAPSGNPPTKATFMRTSSLLKAEVATQELENIPDDFFSSPEAEAASNPPTAIESSQFQGSFSASIPRQRLVAPQTGLRQTTLFGGRAPEEVSSSQAKRVYNYKVDLPPEAPTHHKLNDETLDTWVYPKNLGDTRQYQYSIVKNGLFNNLLVALPTGLGKTFIAATIMYNYFRWTNDAQIVFVAPTKPLVAQQVEACFNIVGLPRSSTTLLTGDQVPALRAEEWESKRVFFMTPQTLINDLSTGIADPKRIVLLVVDEAHRATGEYAYNKVVQFIRRFNKSFRILALTATPGATVEAVQEVIDGLEISKVEIRTEDSIDIQPYTHRRHIDQVLIEPSDEMNMVRELLTKVLQPLANKLCAQNAYWNKDPMSFTSFGLMQARTQWLKSETGRRANSGLKGMMHSLFSVLQSVAHSIKLLNFHGIGPFYESIKAFRDSVEEGKGGKYKTQIVQDADFKKMMDRIRIWLSNTDFVGHPKLTHLCDTILNHFLDAGAGNMGEDVPPASTRVIVFSEYRDSAEDIVRVLNRHGPLIRASVFVGQADSKRSQGMNQEKQQDTIRKFKNGVFNVIVATSIGEEGLDIGSVDLIVCYDASGSPIRMLQRMGRTGRKRAGNIVLLLMRGKEEESFVKAKDNYEQMQKMISSGARFTFRHDLSVRILPKGITPVADHRLLEIPLENTQDKSLPEPKRRPSKAKKKPAKKFHMPDGVETGFQNASRIGEDGLLSLETSGLVVKKPKKIKEVEAVDIPDIPSVLLSPMEEQELEKRYQNVAGADFQEVEMPSMMAQPAAQRQLLPTVKVSHGARTKKCVKLFRALSAYQRDRRFFKPYGDKEPDEASWSVDVPALIEDGGVAYKKVQLTKPTPAKRSTIPTSMKAPSPRLARTNRKAPRKSAQNRARAILETMSDSEQETPRATKHQKARHSAISMSVDETDEEPSSRNIPVSSEGPGDDLERSELPSQDESDGESLVGFVIEDDDVSFSGDRPSSFSTIIPSSPPIRKTKPLNELFTQETQISATQETIDSMPDLDDILGTKSRERNLWFQDDSDDNGPVAGHRKRKRKVIEDDSDE
ncbi:hypothetical protein B0O99DRAFT_587690 [Bisporella sp. PMI_857]|nr:hypothetical protein B0O99DRAFT_587690 [Bisporella sp. PMI_857]